MNYSCVPRLPLLFFLLLLSICVTAQTTAPSGSTVRGKALYTDGQPIKGARVRVFSQQEATRGFSVLTNDRGEFQVSGLAAGKYYVSLEGSGVPAPSGIGMRIPLPMAAIPSATDYPEITPKHDAVFIADGSNPLDIEVKIVRGGTMTGKVMNASGAPVPQAAVNLIAREGADGPYMSRFSTQTDNNGNFRIENLPPGEYLVSASTVTRQAAGDVLARLRGDAQVVTYHPSALRIADALPVKIDSGRESTGVNVSLVRRKTLSISGSVVRGSDGSPLPGAVVVLRNKESDITGPLAPGMMQRTVETGADGQWSFSNVEEGEYQVVALNDPGGRSRGMMSPRPMQPRPSGGPPQMRPSGGPPQMNRMDPGPRPQYMIAQQEINLTGAKIEGLVLTINGPGSIRGLVETETGEAVPAGFPLFFEFSNEGMRPGRPIPARVNADGSFLLTDVQAGESYVTAALPSGARQFIASAEINGEELSRAPVRVVEGAEVGPIRIKLSDKFANVSGRIELNASASDRVVVLFIPVEAHKQRFRTSYTPLQASSDGSFSTRLAPGEYLVLTRNAADLPQIVTAEFIQKLSTVLPRVTVNPGSNPPLQLKLSTP